MNDPCMDSSHAAGQTRAARYIMLAPGSAMIDAALWFLNNCVWSMDGTLRQGSENIYI